jgi:hypothetical protein
MASADYISGPHDTPCICKHDGLRWTKKCVAAILADQTTAGRWAAQQMMARPDTTYTADYRALAAPFLIPESRINEDLR